MQPERIFREEYPKVLATLIRLTGDFDLAEDCVQEAFTAALQKWGFGVPENPGAWLTTVARNRAIDHIRREARFRDKTASFALEQSEDSTAVGGDRLRLFFTCCHPALPAEAQLALTLRTLGGLTTAEIARAFLVPESTMAQRLVRAKRKIKTARIPYRVPEPEELKDRLQSVLTVIYLIFNEGYLATAGPALTRPQLTQDAIRLGRLLREEMPREAEVAGLLALMLLHDSRRSARVGPRGELITLEDQDRRSWDRSQIEEGLRHLSAAMKLAPGRYALEAAIAAEHCKASSTATTDWGRIVELYGQLAEVTSSDIVRLNQAVAVAMAHGPEEGLRRVDALRISGNLETYHLLHSTRGALLKNLGRTDEAAEAFEIALSLAASDSEKAHIQRQIGELRVQ